MVTVKTGVAYRPKHGEEVCGDSIGIWQDRSHTLVAVADGLGSGPPAAEASQQALACVAANRDQPLSEIVTRCHRAIRDTRGVVLGLARVDHKEGRLAFTGVGNIGFSAASANPMQAVCQNGLVGQRLSSLTEFVFPCAPGDLIALFTDGVSAQFKRQGGLAGLSSSHWTEPQNLAQQVIDAFGQAEDDAGVAILMVTTLPFGSKGHGVNYVSG